MFEEDFENQEDYEEYINEKEREKELKRLNKKSIDKILKNWPTTMWLIMLKELFIIQRDEESTKDFFEFYGSPSSSPTRGGGLSKKRKSNKKMRKTRKQ